DPLVTGVQTCALPISEGLLNAFPSISGEKRRLEAIPGSPPSLLTPPSGCRFHPRCKYAKDVCTTDPPPYVVPEPGHRALCHFSQIGRASCRERLGSWW